MKKLSQLNLKILIGGTWCSGTRFVASLLTANGFLCGHEKLFYNPSDGWHTHDLDFPVTSMLANSSYTTFELCNTPPLDELPIVMLLRRPEKILNSKLAFDLNQGRPADPAQCIQQMLLNYETLLSTNRVALHLRLEKSLYPLFDFLGIQFKFSADDLNRHNNGRINLSRTDYLRFPGFSLLEDIYHSS